MKQWTSLRDELAKVFPDREHEPVELELNHPVFHSFYEIKEKPQVPSIQHYLSGLTTETADAKQAHYHGISDEKGRLRVIVCRNTDLGDGWERGVDHPGYNRDVSQSKAFPMGVNIVVYALTQGPAPFRAD
jgi:hypothetical protein